MLTRLELQRPLCKASFATNHGRSVRAVSRDSATYLCEPVTYEPVGATAGELPVGFHHLRRSQVIGQGQQCFDRAAEQVMTWQVQRGAGLQVDASADRAALGVVVLSSLRLGPVCVVVPCKVVAVVDEPTARGFAYGTLRGHPECGEERFTVTLQRDGRVVLHIVAFSRPATWFVRLGAPIASRIQRRTTTRYLNALVDKSLDG